jgi:hypothetical protein
MSGGVLRSAGEIAVREAAAVGVTRMMPVRKSGDSANCRRARNAEGPQISDGAECQPAHGSNSATAEMANGIETA